MPSFTSVHLVTTHPASAILPTLQSLVAQTNATFQVILVENTAESLDLPWSHGCGSDVMRLRNFRDQGFARSHNQALTSLFARWPQSTWNDRFILFLSGRLILAPDALHSLAEALECDSSLMVAAPKVRQAHFRLRENDEEPVLMDTGVIEQVGIEAGKAFEPFSRGKHQKDEGQYDQMLDVFLPGTWCLLVRASALMQARVGDEWFDNDLSEGWAMVDLGWRLRMLGMPMRWVPQALTWIQVPASQSLSLARRLSRWYGRESLHARIERSYACIVRCKNMSFGRLCLILPWLIPVWIVRLFATLADPRVLPGMVRSWFILPRALRKRRFLQLAIRRSRG